MRSLGISHLRPPAPPPQEAPSRLRRTFEGLRHSLGRDAEAIHHHYDVSNTFYEYVLGPSMTYTCAVFPTEDATLEEAQSEKYDLVARKLDLQAGQRLLDLGCGWGGMVRHAAREYGVHTIGVTLSREQATWAQEKIKEEGLDHLAEVRHMDYRHVEEREFDAISSIGLTEHIGVKNYPAYFGFIRDRLRPQGRLLNHCITRHDNRWVETGQFLDRYVFPDGELIGSGKIITEVQNAGLEVQHEENFRVHYAKTLAGWCHNLADNWDACVAEVGEGTARVWGLYMAGSRIAFERNEIQLHHVLATKTDADGVSGYPLRHGVGPSRPSRLDPVNRLAALDTLATSGEHPGQPVRRARRAPRRAVAAPGPAHPRGRPGASSRPASPTSGSGWWCRGSSRAATTRSAPTPTAPLVLDVVLHEVGLVTEWVVRDDCVGSTVTITEPKGSFDPPPDAAWLMLVGDLTGMPAMARIAESVDLPTRIWAEVRRRPARLPPGHRGRHLARGARRGPAGWPRSSSRSSGPTGDGYFWMAGESAQMRAIRKYLMRERKLPARRTT